MNVENRVDRVDWDVILEKSVMQKSVIDFSLGLLSRDDFYNYSIFIGVGPYVRKLIRNNSVQNARKLARKALKRRGILNKNNLTNPRVYAQL